MTSRFLSRRSGRVVAAGTALATGLVAFGLPAAPAFAAPGDEAPRIADGAGGSDTVTLITGDRVTLTHLPDGTQAVAIDAVDEDASIRTFQAGGDLHVIPGDAEAYIASGAMDGDLFNVSKLIEYGYDDSSVDATPVIVEEWSAAREAPLPGVVATTELPSVGGTAAIAAHADAAAFWSAITDASSRSTSGEAGLARGIKALHLDGKVQATLDSSVPWVDAPTAWDLGLAGDGVTVAVLDTGYDDTHPDLADRVLAESTSFVPGEDVASDPNGHGTHVASTIAGTGAASEGTHRGVAADADLLVGKVLSEDGYGQDSWIIAAMEWAANRAPIVSMSLGSPEPSDGTDLTAVALERLAAETGSLFVVAAGNSSAPETIGSPASAASALTVGSVDDPTGVVSRFSSQGPLAGSGALKPDIAGPGEDVTAARSSDSGGDGAYVSFNGTSMATPHVAGAAAILKQQHPEYTGPQLKAALVSSASPSASSAYQVGSGVLDVGNAVQAPLVASGSGDFGLLAWGADAAPVERTVEYFNPGQAGVTVTLDATLVDVTPLPDDEASARDLPENIVTVDAETLTVSPGETRSVLLRLDPTRIPVGAQLSGALVASVDGQEVARTALAAMAETERYDLTLSATDFEGRPASAVAYLWDDETLAPLPVVVNGETTLRLPLGTYSVMSYLELARTPDTAAVVLVGDPDVVVDQARSVALDARSAEEISVDVGQRGLEATFRRLDYTANGVGAGALIPVRVDELWAQPMTAETADFDFTTRWRLQQPALSVSADGTALDVIAQVGSTPLDGRLRERAVAAGRGSAADFAAVNAQGRVAVVTRSDAVSPSERAANAAAEGARLLVVVNDADGEISEWVGSEDGVTATPIPVAAVSGVDGRRLLERMSSRRVTVQASGVADAEEIWDVARNSDGEIPADLAYRPSNLARIETTYHGQPEQVSEFRYDFAPGVEYGNGFPLRTTRGIQRTEWVSTDQVSWYQNARVDSVGWDSRDVKRAYAPRERTDTSYFGAVVRPYVGPGFWAPHRSGDGVQVNIPSWADGANATHTGAFDLFSGLPGFAQQTDIYVDDELVASGPTQGAAAWDLPDGEIGMRVVNIAEHDGSHLSTSTSTTTEWGFRSTGSAQDGSTQLLPMIQAFYDVELGDDGRAGEGRRRGEPVDVRIELGHVGGATGAARITNAALEARGADGRWRPVALNPARSEAPSGATEAPPGIFAEGRSFVRAFESELPAPDRGGWVDLRLTATDAAGSTFSQEIVRAVEVAPARNGGGHDRPE